MVTNITFLVMYAVLILLTFRTIENILVSRIVLLLDYVNGKLLVIKEYRGKIRIKSMGGRDDKLDKLI